MCTSAGRLLSLLAISTAMTSLTTATAAPLRNIMYLTGQHPIVPDLTLTASITHVVLAFMSSASFNEDVPDPKWPLFMSVRETRSKFKPGTAVMVAIGGWGDTGGFETAARTEANRTRFAKNVAAMVDATGADGVDIDWEYPGGNGEDYKTDPNSSKRWEISAYPLLLSSIRTALGPDRLVSAATPGLPRDMMAFSFSTIPEIMASADFLNVMTYDLMNRRDNVTKHHTGVQNSIEAIDAYAAAGAPPEKLNLGFAFYVKYFRIAKEHHDECVRHPIGCPTGLMEDPITGGDLGRTGGFSWHDAVPEAVSGSFSRARKSGKYDDAGGGYYYFDDEEDLWWTFDTPEAIEKKFPLIVRNKALGGVFAWGLGEDALEWKHLAAVNKGLKNLEVAKDEL